MGSNLDSQCLHQSGDATVERGDHRRPRIRTFLRKTTEENDGRPGAKVREWAVSESWFVLFKNELIDTRAWPTIAGVHRATFEYIEGWYNVRRLHSTLGYLSPAAYEATIHHTTARRRHSQHQPVRRTGSSPGAEPVPCQRPDLWFELCPVSTTGSWRTGAVLLVAHSISLVAPTGGWRM